MSSVAAVVVTFNRKDLLLECLDALLNQSRKINRVFLIDNASSDGTQQLLKEKGYLDNLNIDYQLMPENLGGAGGFYQGVKSAYEAEYDWIWVMDDDAEPEPESLEKMQPYFLDEDTVATCPLITDSERVLDVPSHHRGWFTPFDGETVVRPITTSEIGNKLTVSIDHCSFVGLCFRASSIKAIGLPKSEFFIHYDDFEFCTRLVRVGKIILVTNSFIKHKEAAKIGLENTKKLFGRSSTRINYDKLWIRYFGYRNRTWMIWHNKIPSDFGSLLINHLRLILGIVIYDDNKYKRIRFWNAAFIDGISGVFDNSKPRKLLKSK